MCICKSGCNIEGDNRAVLHIKSIDAPNDGLKRQAVAKLYFDGGEYNLPLQQMVCWKRESYLRPRHTNGLCHSLSRSRSPREHCVTTQIGVIRVRALLTLAAGLVLCASVMADIVPGTLDVRAAFEKSDLVRNCFVRSIAVIEERSIVNRPGVFIIRRRMRANVEIQDLYKSQEPNRQSIVVEYVQDIPNMSASQPALRKSETALLFLKATGSATYVFADPFLGATPFSSLPRQTGKLGLAKLESALVGAKGGKVGRVPSLGPHP